MCLCRPPAYVCLYADLEVCLSGRRHTCLCPSEGRSWQGGCSVMFSPATSTLSQLNEKYFSFQISHTLKERCCNQPAVDRSEKNLHCLFSFVWLWKTELSIPWLFVPVPLDFGFYTQSTPTQKREQMGQRSGNFSIVHL